MPSISYSPGPGRKGLSLRSHLWLPLIAFAAAFGALELLTLDPVIARAWYFDTHSLQWAGAGAGSWWARDLLHGGGRWLIRSIAAGAILVWAASFVVARARSWRRDAAFIAIAMVTATAVVGALKALTNVDCPWDLAAFGGHNPYVALFADRPDSLPRAQCFPGAHASSGFALMCFYFVLRDRNPRAAPWALGIAISIGIAFSIGQEARGAHFISHDLVSAGLVWFVQLALYCGTRRQPHVVVQAVRQQPHDEERHDGIREEMRAGSDPGDRHHHAEGYGRGDYRATPPTQRVHDGDGKESRGGLAGGERTVLAALAAEGECRREGLTTAELHDIARTRAPEVILESEIDDQAGAQDEHQQEVADLPAIDAPEVTPAQPVERPRGDEHGEGRAEKERRRFPDQFLQRSGDEGESVGIEQAGNEQVDLRKGDQQQGAESEANDDEAGARLIDIPQNRPPSPSVLTGAVRRQREREPVSEKP